VRLAGNDSAFTTVVVKFKKRPNGSILTTVAKAESSAVAVRSAIYNGRCISRFPVN
jgi:hypothetical protein